MERVLEAELMDDAQQARAYSEADFEAQHGRLVEILGQTFAGVEFSGEILDLGCGPGDVTFRVARRYPRARVTGIDGSAPMIALAERRKLEHPAVAGQVAFLQRVLPSNDLPRKPYSLILSSSFLHHLHAAQILWQTIVEHAVAGTRIFVADLCRPESEDAARAIVEAESGNEPEVLKRDYYNSLLAAFTPDEVRAQLVNAGLAGLSVRVDRYVLVSGRIGD